MSVRSLLLASLVVAPTLAQASAWEIDGSHITDCP